MNEPNNNQEAAKWQAAVAEYFNWLTSEEVNSSRYQRLGRANAMADASSKLGCLLIKHEVYSPEPESGFYCRSHRRPATHRNIHGAYKCDPKLGGIMLPCEVVPKDQMTDD